MIGTAERKSLGFEAFRCALVEASDRVRAARLTPSELDDAGGGVDLGSTLAAGFAAAVPALADWDEPADVGAALMHIGAHMGQGRTSTTGVLLNVALVSAGREVLGVTELSTQDVATILRAATDAVARHELVTVGERTVLDAMEPAAVAAEQASHDRRTAIEAMCWAAEAARTGARATAKMALAHGHQGRTDRYATPDAGATAWALFLTCIAETLGRDRT